MKYPLLGFYLILVYSFFGQVDVYNKNLIPNASFEHYNRGGTLIRHAKPWQTIEDGDFYHKALNDDPSPHAGAVQGNSYVGIRFRKKHREYIQVRLSQTLAKGAIYRLSFYWRKAYWSTAQLSRLGYYLGSKPFRKSMQVVSVDTFAHFGLDGTSQWVESRFVFQAKGFERFLCIGNFSENYRKDLIKDHALRMFGVEAYYFIDSVSLKLDSVMVKPPPPLLNPEQSLRQKISLEWKDQYLSQALNPFDSLSINQLLQWSGIFPNKPLLVSISHVPYPWYVSADDKLDEIQSYLIEWMERYNLNNRISVRQHITHSKDDLKNKIEIEIN